MKVLPLRKGLPIVVLCFCLSVNCVQPGHFFSPFIHLKVKTLTAKHKNFFHKEYKTKSYFEKKKKGPTSALLSSQQLNFLTSNTVISASLCLWKID